jgi:hypothetical protein
MNIHRELKTMQKEQSLIQKELKEAQHSLKEYKNRDTEEEKSVITSALANNSECRSNNNDVLVILGDLVNKGKII